MTESYNWLLNIIASCKAPFQLDCCHTLIALFRQRFTDTEGFGPLYDDLLKHVEAKDALLII